MAERRWFRSLYWRFGLGFFTLVAVLLGAQAAAFVWIVSATEGGVPQRVGQDFAVAVAAEIEAALTADATLDLARDAATRLADLSRPAFVVLPGGRIVGPPGIDPPAGWQRLLDVRERLARRPRVPLRTAPPARDAKRPPAAANPEASSTAAGEVVAGQTPSELNPPDVVAPWRPGAAPVPPPPWWLREGGPVPDADERRRPVPVPGLMPGVRPMAAVPVRDGRGRVAALVVVPPLIGWRRVATNVGPWLAVGSLLLLAAGTGIAALLVFRPAHARLRALEGAARAFGEGNLSARAPATGGDEVAAVAGAFNRMADDLAARQAQLAGADRARRQLLADVSHELMTPLTAIRGYAETLALPQFGPASPEGRRAVAVIQEEGERIERLVGDLLDLARFEASGTALAVDDVPVAELFERVVARHEPAAREKGLAIDVRLPDEEMTVRGDAHRLEQALQNLAANAVRHAPRGSTVVVGAERADGSTRLWVRDHGPGIAPEHLPFVFDRFYKGDPSRSAAGSGLGLSIVKAIVERHGGTVHGSSEPGVMTEFAIVLPLAGPPDPGRAL